MSFEEIQEKLKQAGAVAWRLCEAFHCIPCQKQATSGKIAEECEAVEALIARDIKFINTDGFRDRSARR